MALMKNRWRAFQFALAVPTFTTANTSAMATGHYLATTPGL